MVPYALRRYSTARDARRSRGAAAMVAILGLVALLFVVLAVMWLAYGAHYLSQRQKRVIALRSLAEGGLQYGYWQVVFNSALPPLTFGPTTLGNGTFTVVLSDNTAQIANTYKLVSTASINGETLTYTRVIDGKSAQVQGKVFEDINYGGGAGRSYTASSGSGVTGATVELYSAAGGYLGAATTDTSGAYTLTGLLTATNYTLRVVNSTVPSTRTGYTSSLIGVQTYRTNGSGGTAVGVADHVGGEDPSKTDAAANSGSFSLAGLTAGGATPQSIATVTPADNMSGVDFGYNFDTVVSVRDSGQGSLRQALTNGNALSNSGLAQSGKTAGVENVLFMLPTGSTYAGSNSGYASAFISGIATVALASALPAISSTLTLDATGQSGWSSAPILELNGAGAGASAYGLDVTAANCTVRGIIVNRCTLAGIRFSGSATGSTIQGCYLGVNSAGTAASANQNGLQLYTASNQVGGTAAWQKCLLSGNTQRGLMIYGTAATGNSVQNCYIGVNAAGTGTVGNGSDGLAIYAPSNTIGGTSSSARCIICGNGGSGIFVDTNGGAVTATANTIQGCFVGTNAAGTAALANSTAGITLGSASNVVGGTAAGAGCLLSGNTQYGLIMNGSGAATNVVQGNYCGTNATGTGPLPNGIYGIYIHIAASCQIGGTATGAGNLVSGNSSSGIFADSAATGTQIQGNLIGVTLSGAGALPNGDNGILLSGCNSNTIGGTATGAGNLISGNTNDGIQVAAASASNVVQGNTLGLNQTGTAAIPNGGNAIDINNGVNNAIGGTVANAANICAGNTLRGIFLQGASTGNTIEGNRSGLNAAGTAAIPNGYSGITLTGSTVTGNTVGGTTVGARNVAAGNNNYGIFLNGCTGNTVQGNYVGLNSAGTSAVGNGLGGVLIYSGAANNTIGGSTAGARNVISGNSVFGVSFSSSGSGNAVQGNYIGLDAAGAAGIPNTVGILGASGSGNTIGGTSAGQGNTIAYNTNQGINLVSGTGNAIEGNSMYSNGSIGIDLGGDGITANNGTKNSSLPNYDMDFPAFTSVLLSSTMLTVTGYVGSAAGQSTFATARVEVFKSSKHPSGYGEGQTYLGYLTTNASGNFSGSITVSGLTASDSITATATDASGNSSEFGPNVRILSPFDYALVSNGNINSSNLKTGTSGANGDVYSNGNINISGSSVVNGNALAVGTCSVVTITGAKTVGAPSMTLTAIDTAYYSSIADVTYNGNLTWGGGTQLNFTKAYEVIYINGNLTVSGNDLTVSGTGTVIVNGTITLNKSILYANGAAKLAMLALNSISFNDDGIADGFYYAHNLAGTATAVTTNNELITGCVIADVTTLNSTPTIIHDSVMNATFGHNMHLPGY